jgi:hypothetical protein
MSLNSGPSLKHTAIFFLRMESNTPSFNAMITSRLRILSESLRLSSTLNQFYRLGVP